VAEKFHRAPRGTVLLKPDRGGVAAVREYGEILSALDRIRKSHAMRSCDRLVQLLTFVVEATLKGEASNLKETTIGVFVFGRRPDYNPKVDTIVRSQAWRLRGKLKTYYASEGSWDPLIIDLPRGRYVPVFRLRGPEGA
jgi:hypothetical protein